MSSFDSHSGPQLGRSQIMTLLTDLGGRMHQQGLVANIYVVGGAAIALTLKDDRVTQDIDAVMTDHSIELRKAAVQVARENGISEDWMSDDISDFVSKSPAGEETEITLPGLRVMVASPEHLLAMKTRASAARAEPKDADDLVFLAEHVGLNHPAQVARLTASQFEGIYRDNLGYDEYVEAARFAFVQVALERGEDPTAYYLDEEPDLPPTGSDHTPAHLSLFPELRDVTLDRHDLGRNEHSASGTWDISR